MINRPEDRRPPLTPQLALRVAVVGSLALTMFAIMFFRLWFLQVLSGDQYIAQAQGNQTRTLDVPAARGQILDRSGNILVDSKPAIAVVISPPDLPKNARARAGLLVRLARVLGEPITPEPCPVEGGGVQHLAPIPCAVAQQQAKLSYANVTIKVDVSRDVLGYLEERQDEFPGVQIQQVWLRTYPLHDIAAQLFGTVGPITQPELALAHYRGAGRTAIVGQSGLEYTYDNYLRGIDGASHVQVDAFNRFKGYLGQRQPIAGHTLKLSLDLNLQRAGQQALQEAINNNPPASGGAFVAMNPQDGEVYAMGSLPTFDPNIFTHPISAAAYKALNNPSNNFPLINRAVQSAGPTGSTFKPITATAALQSGAWSVGETFDDTGKFCEAGGLCRRNAGGAAFGVLDLVNALRVSDDVFFYNLGALLNSARPSGGQLQRWARAYGIGQKTGIDLGGEVAGNLPTPLWREHVNAEEAACDRRHHRPPGGCGIADGSNRPWSQGDNVNLAVGQGDVQVTPLQLAVAYSTIANGGAVVRPHLGLEVDSADGTLLQKISPPAARYIHVNPTYLDTIRTGLHDAAQAPGGTSFDVMGTFPRQVYGKTGTAQYNNQQDYSWYVCFVPSWATPTPIVVAVWVEQGGFGAAAAAPAAREILSQWFTGHRGKFVVGSSKTL